MRVGTATLAVLGAALVAPSAAPAALLVDVSGSSVKPNIAGAPSSMTIKGTMSDTTGAKPPTPKYVLLRFPPGGRVDPTVPGFCDLTKLTVTGTCPKASVVATGTSLIDVRFGGIDKLTATLTTYNVKPGPGEKARFVIHAIENQVTGTVADITGRVVPAPNGGLQLELQDLDQQIPTVLGIQPSVIGMDVTTRKITKRVGARRGAKRGKGKRRKARQRGRIASFITNPPTCTGTWEVTGEFGFTDGQVLTGAHSVPCRNK